VTVVVATAVFATPSPSSAARARVVLSGFPALKQQHELTCEASAASMATRGLVPESQIMAAMPRRANPNLGFRGNPDGLQGTKLVDYGVYAQPLHVALAKFGYSSDVLMYGSDATIRGYLNRGWPVIAWITYGLQPATPRLVQHDGVQFFLVPHEHAVLIFGYGGGGVFANDPWNRTVVRYGWNDFNRSWGHFANMALAVEPCAAPQPVPSIRVADVTNGTVTWKWPSGQNASAYDVTISKQSGKPRTLFHALQLSRTASYANAVPGALYEISVVSVSACNEQSPATNLWFQMPLGPGTTTPTPATGTVQPAATSTATPRSTP
jgi:uncharacterized protein YvpB